MKEYVEISKDNITFYGNTPEEKKANEKIFDLTIEIDRLQQENHQLKEIEKEHQKINGDLRVENKELREDYNKEVHEATEFESKVYELQDRIDKTIECISQMIFKGYRDETIEYFATGEKSEFGIRAKVILEKLKGAKNEMDHR